MKKVAEFLWESNLIEGYNYPTSFYVAALAGHKSADKHVKNSIAAWHYVFKNHHKDPDWKNLFTLHRKQMTGLLRRDRCGVMRAGFVRVRASVPPPPWVVPTDLKQWFDSFENKSPLSLHLEFERIHPFWDGNGRVGRLLWAWHRLKRGMPIKPILSEFEGSTFVERRANYYERIYKYGETWNRQRDLAAKSEERGGEPHVSDGRSAI